MVPKMDDEIESTTKQYMVCQEHAQRPSKSYATQTWPARPWRRPHTDFGRPFMG